MWEHVKDGVKESVKIIESTWIKNGMAIAKSGEYARSVHSFVITDSDEEITGVVFNNAPYASALEYGLDPFDMKPYFIRSKRAKISKKGIRYLIIPLRHGVPGTKTMPAMPHNIYQRAKRNGRIGESTYGQRSKLVKNYEWNKSGKPTGLQNYTWKTGKYSGLVKKGRARHTQYMTFRIVSQNSPAGSWWHPGIKAKYIAKKTADEVTEQIQKIISESLNQDIQDILSKGGGII